MGAPVLAKHFLADVARVAAALPAGDHVLNVCSDRYRFTVGFAASLVAGKISLLPSTHTPEVIRQLTVFARDVFCLTDDLECEIELPRTMYPEGPGSLGGPTASAAVPEIHAGQLAAYVFTSGVCVDGSKLIFPATRLAANPTVKRYRSEQTFRTWSPAGRAAATRDTSARKCFARMGAPMR